MIASSSSSRLTSLITGKGIEATSYSVSNFNHPDYRERDWSLNQSKFKMGDKMQNIETKIAIMNLIYWFKNIDKEVK